MPRTWKRAVWISWQASHLAPPFSRTWPNCKLTPRQLNWCVCSTLSPFTCMWGHGYLTSCIATTNPNIKLLFWTFSILVSYLIIRSPTIFVSQFLLGAILCVTPYRSSVHLRLLHVCSGYKVEQIVTWHK